MIKRPVICFLVAVLTICACKKQESEEIRWQDRAPLPEPVSNNAVAAVNLEDNRFLYSFLGLSEEKTFHDVHSKTFRYDVDKDTWLQLEDVPGSAGRLAGTSAVVEKEIYIFGGYTVAEDGSEKSVPDVYQLSPGSNTYKKITEMPVPVDDAVSLVYRDRYIYLVSGWHDTANVDHVQVYDTEMNSWKQADRFPGAPVFGHAGGISENKMVICDGVKIVPDPNGGRKFVMSDECWLGRIDSTKITNINWDRLSEHPGPARYRMAAIGDDGKVLFAGGSNNPYNYDGIGYDGVPSQPDSLLFAYHLIEQEWRKVGYLPVATMDHRSLAKAGEWYYIVGGMLKNQEVSSKVFRFKLDSE